MRPILLLAALPFVAYAIVADASVDNHTKALQAAQSLNATFTVTKVGGTTEEQTLSLSRPKFLKWESPSKVVVSDGKILWAFDKAAKTYTKGDATDEAIAKALGDDTTWAWSAFFDKDFAASIASSQKGSSRKVRNMAVTDLALVRKDKRSFTLPISDESGVAVGARFTTETGETIILAKDFTIGKEPLLESQFAWTPPADAKDAAEVAASAMPFSEVKMIFDANCASCHGGRAPKGGIDLSSYSAIMSSRAVRPGNANSSRLMREIRSGKMPPAGPLSAELQDKLAKWIDSGAKE
jgi:outer membrane lipoprotein-sorting protein